MKLPQLPGDTIAIALIQPATPPTNQWQILGIIFTQSNEPQVEDLRDQDIKVEVVEGEIDRINGDAAQQLIERTGSWVTIQHLPPH